MTKQVKFGYGEKQLTDQEKQNILYQRNSRNTLKNGQVLLADRSYSNGLMYDLWGKGILPDAKFLKDRIQTYFVNLFEWTGEDVTEQFKVKLEQLLFRYGKAAVVKMPDGNFYPVDYNWDSQDEDFYGDPTKITIITDNKFNGKIFKKDRFVIIKNNQDMSGTLAYAFERLRQINRAIIDVDNASLISRPKWGVNISADDAAIADIENAMTSNRAIIATGNIDFREGGLEDLTGTDTTESRINLYQFQVNNLLLMLGLDVNDGNIKAERMSELEVAKSEKFDGLLIKDMFERRLAVIDDLKELGMNIQLEERVEEEETEVNGELNKDKVERAENEETN